MGLMKSGLTVASDMTNTILPYSVSTATTDGATGSKKNTYTISNGDVWLGYYKNIPEVRVVVDTRATWTVGKGYKTDDLTKAIFDNIRGFGKDTFNTIIENLTRTMLVWGDTFAEIILDDEGDLLNLKPLDPSSMQINYDGKGIITSYTQISKTDNPNKEFEPQEIFHLARNRIADEIHGQSMLEPLKYRIDTMNEAIVDMREVFHRFVKPKYIFQLDTDDPVEIAKFKATKDASTAAGENLYLPLGSVTAEQISIAPNSTLNPLPWIQMLKHDFFQAAGVPEVLVGGSQEFTEATAKIVYLAFQQNVEQDQLFLEQQIFSQLGYTVEFDFPVSLENELLSDKNKDGAVNVQPNEMTAGAGQ